MTLKRPAGIKLSALWREHTPLQDRFEQAVRASDRVVLRCGRQVGKTEFLARLVVRSLLKGRDVWWLAPTHQLNKVGFRRCIGLIRKLPVSIRKRFRVQRSSPFEIQYGNALCTFLSTSAPDSLQGATLDLVVVDEAATERDLQHILEQYVEPTLAIRKGKLILASTPKGENDFARYCRHPNWLEVHAPTTANPLIDPEWIEARRRELESEGRLFYFRQEYLAEIVDEIGVFFEKLPVVQELPTLPVYDYCGIDWGSSSPYAAVYLSVDSERIYVHDEFYRRHATPDEQAKQILSRKAQLYVVDPSLPETVAVAWKEAGLVPKLGSRDRIGGLELIRDLIAQNRLVISSRCHQLIREFHEAVRDVRRPDDLVGDDHALDALRYAVVEAVGLLWQKERSQRHQSELYENLQADRVMVALSERARQMYIRQAMGKRRR